MLTIASLFLLTWQLVVSEALGGHRQQRRARHSKPIREMSEPQAGPAREMTEQHGGLPPELSEQQGEWPRELSEQQGVGRRFNIPDLSGHTRPNRTIIVVITFGEPVLQFAGGQLQGCPREQPPCFISDGGEAGHTSAWDADIAAAAVFNGRFMNSWYKTNGKDPWLLPRPWRKPAGQRWVFNFFNEPALCPQKIQETNVDMLEDKIDWTMGEWSDADFFLTADTLVERPGKTPSKSSFLLRSASWEKEKDSPTTAEGSRTALGPASGKTMLLLWMVSDCKKQPRWDYWKHLSALLPKNRTKMLGHCAGEQPCGDTGWGADEHDDCHRELYGKFKFYAAFENTQCSGYVTEKFWRGFTHGMVPVALGGMTRNDYDKLAPRGSYLHIDDFPNVQALADRLMQLDADDAAYNAMFAWRETHVLSGVQAMIKPYCELCAELHKQPSEQFPVNNFAGLGSLKKWFYEKTCRKPAVTTLFHANDIAANDGAGIDNTSLRSELSSDGIARAVTHAEKVARWYGWDVGGEKEIKGNYSGTNRSEFAASRGDAVAADDSVATNQLRAATQ